MRQIEFHHGQLLAALFGWVMRNDHYYRPLAAVSLFAQNDSLSRGFAKAVHMEFPDLRSIPKEVMQWEMICGCECFNAMPEPKDAYEAWEFVRARGWGGVFITQAGAPQMERIRRHPWVRYYEIPRMFNRELELVVWGDPKIFPAQKETRL